MTEARAYCDALASVRRLKKSLAQTGIFGICKTVVSLQWIHLHFYAKELLYICHFLLCMCFDSYENERFIAVQFCRESWQIWNCIAVYFPVRVLDDIYNKVNIKIILNLRCYCYYYDYCNCQPCLLGLSRSRPSCPFKARSPQICEKRPLASSCPSPFRRPAWNN